MLDSGLVLGISAEAAASPQGLADAAVYHYHPSLEQVRTWIREARMEIGDEGTGSGYEHFLVQLPQLPEVSVGPPSVALSW
ncbi:MAG: hypothetical protein PVH41_16870 [Anaerolineae bacterium]